MAYRITHHKADGTTQRTRVDGKSVSTFAPQIEGTRGVVVKDSGQRFAAMNLHPSKSKYRRTRQIAAHLDDLRKDYTSTRGFSRYKTMKHVASIPPEYWYTEKWERGPNALRDPKELRKYCRDNGFNVSKW